MALYTELFKDYLKAGNELPAVFQDIDGLDALFTAYYFDNEIGFETEDIFKLKLEMLANIVVPAYKNNIEALASNYLKLPTAAKTYYKHDVVTFNAGRQHTENTGNIDSTVSRTGYGTTATTGDNTILPVNAAEANPSNTNNGHTRVDNNYSDATDTDSTASTTSDAFVNTTDTEHNSSEQLSQLELLQAIDILNEKVNMLMLKLLAEFKTLFMQVY